MHAPQGSPQGWACCLFRILVLWELSLELKTLSFPPLPSLPSLPPLPSPRYLPAPRSAPELQPSPPGGAPAATRVYRLGPGNDPRAVAVHRGPRPNARRPPLARRQLQLCVEHQQPGQQPADARGRCRRRCGSEGCWGGDIAASPDRQHGGEVSAAERWALGSANASLAGNWRWNIYPCLKTHLMYCLEPVNFPRLP